MESFLSFLGESAEKFTAFPPTEVVVFQGLSLLVSGSVVVRIPPSMSFPGTA